jgi:hypothetical protein
VKLKHKVSLNAPAPASSKKNAGGSNAHHDVSHTPKIQRQSGESLLFDPNTLLVSETEGNEASNRGNNNGHDYGRTFSFSEGSRKSGSKYQLSFNLDDDYSDNSN